MLSLALIPPLLFLLLLSCLAGIGLISYAVPFLYLAASMLAFVLYRHDKEAARDNRWRTSENRLHLVGLLGGWPGALLAQKLLRHKTRKLSFRILFWLTVLLNCAGLILFLSPAWLTRLP